MEEIWRLRQKEEPRVRGGGGAREKGSRSPPQRGGRGGGFVERGGERDRTEKERQKLARPAGMGRDLQLKDTEKGRWMVEKWGSGGPCGAGSGPAVPPPVGLPRPPTPRLGAPRTPITPPPPARARRLHEIGCSRNESAPRGGG